MLAVVTTVVAILAEVLIGFALARTRGLQIPASGSVAMSYLAKAPILGLGIAWLVSILAHAVGLFLQQEDFEQANQSAANGNTEDEKPRSPALYPGYVLALIAFAVSSLAGVVCILVSGVLLLALLAYYRDLWNKPVLGPIVLAGAKALAVLLGATVGGWRGQGTLLPELILACLALAVYTWAAEVTVHTLPRRGMARWRITVISGLVGLAMTIAAFRSFGPASPGPWMVVWLALWLTARSATLCAALGKLAGPRMEQTLTRQFQRGELLLLAGVVAALLPDWQAAIAFAAVFVLFPIAALLDRR